MIFIARVIAISLGFALFVSSMAPSARAIGGDQFLSLCSKNADKSDQDFCLGYVFAIAEALHGLADQTVCIQGASRHDDELYRQFARAGSAIIR